MRLPASQCAGVAGSSPYSLLSICDIGRSQRFLHSSLAVQNDCVALFQSFRKIWEAKRLEGLGSIFYDYCSSAAHTRFRPSRLARYSASFDLAAGRLTEMKFNVTFDIAPPFGFD
jgi:hypothetical protein